MERFATYLSVAVALLGLGMTPARAEVLVATAGPMSGQYSWFGEQMQRGAELAVADLNIGRLHVSSWPRVLKNSLDSLVSS